MRTLRLFMTMSCDGFFAGPGGELDWMSQVPDQEMNRDVVDLLSQADMGIMGYPVASGMIPYWRQVASNPESGEAERAIADVVNRIPCVVLSNTKDELEWDNAELLVVRDDGDLWEAVNGIKQRPGGDIGVPGGVRTARNLTRLGLIDEYVLMMHPVALGEGQRVFTQRADLSLVDAKTYPSGVTRLVYRPRDKD